MRKIVIVKEPSILRTGLVKILESMSKDVKVIVYDASEMEAMMELSIKVL
ncbi:hypothetical protein [Ornithinibacillus gellani]|nr:hypothetical protein [Ornithinibacillus gellani]